MRFSPVLFFSIIALFLSSLASCNSNGTYRKFEGSVWTTSFHIIYCSNENLDDSIRVVMNQVDASLSKYNPKSLISQINQGQTGKTDSMIAEVFSLSSQVSKLSQGLYDPTIGPVVSLYGFGKAKNEKIVLPDSLTLEQELSSVGIGDCHLNSGNLIKKSAKTEFDFSSIAKGYACDQIGKLLQQHGCNDYMVEIGGEIALSGKNQKGEDWHIMIDAPIDNNLTVTHKELQTIIPGKQYPGGKCGVATSGNYRNYKTAADGSRINHIIDAHTGRMASSPVLSATVIAPNCALADALATACMVMQPDSALVMMGKFPQTSVLLVVGDRIITAGNLFKAFPTPDNE